MRWTVTLMLVVGSVLGALPCRAAVEHDSWSVASPGTLIATRQSQKSPDGSDVTRLSFAPKGGGESYWASASVDLDAPTSDNLVAFQARSSYPRTVGLKLIDSQGRAGYFHVKLTERWQRYDLRRERPDWIEGPEGALADIRRVEWIFNSGDYTSRPIQLFVSNLTFERIDPQPLRLPDWMPATVPPPVDGYRIETCLHTVWREGQGEFFGVERPGGLELAKDLYDHLAEEYGHVGLIVANFNLRGDNARTLAEYVRSRGGFIGAEGHHTGVNIAAAINIHGQDPFEAGWPAARYHGEDPTHPEVFAYLENKTLESAKVGAQAWRVVDYIWPYHGGGIWGYSPSAIETWKQAVTNTDSGIEVRDGDRTYRVGFWDYFESYMGYRMEPSDLGLTAWDQYLPPAANAADSAQTDNARTVFNLLFHYQWVRQLNELTRSSVAYGLGSQPITNPEYFANGTDLYWLLHASNVRGANVEWWGGSGIVLPTYYNGRYFDRVAQRMGKELVLHGESAAAGGNPYDGRPHYWDNQANYLITYAQAGSLDFKAKHDQYWGSSWEKMTDPTYPEYQSYTAFRSAWSGFLQCRNDRAFKPKADVLAVTHRPIVREFSSFDQEHNDQPYNLGRYLMALNYLHDGGAFPLEDALDLNDYRVIVHSATDPPARFLDQLANWLGAEANRTVVTHGFVPTRVAAPYKGLHRAGQEGLQPGGAEKQLGFDSISATPTRTGIVQTSDPAFAEALADYVGRRVELSQPIYDAPAGEALVTLGDRPLVSIRPCGAGRVLYLHLNAQASDAEEDQFLSALTDGAMRYLDEQPTAISEQYRVLVFDRTSPESGDSASGDGGKSVIFWNTQARTDTRVASGEVFNIFQAQNPQVTGSIRLSVDQPNHPYRISNMLTDESRQLTSDDRGWIDLDPAGWNMGGLYVQAID